MADVETGEERRPSAAAGGGSPLRASMVLLVLVAVVAVAVPIILLACFHKHPMSQIWILSVNICSYVFLLLRLCPTTRWFYTDFARLSYGLLLAFFSAIVIGPTTTTLVLFFSTAWAAGYGGYSLALHRLRKGTEPAIHALPCPSRPITDCVKSLNFTLYIVEPVLVLLWTLFMALFFYITALPDEPPDELGIFMILLYFGFIHVSCWVMFVALVPMYGVLMAEYWSALLVATLVVWMMVSPVIYIVSQIIPILSSCLLMVASVAFIWYNLAIYMHFLATATPRGMKKPQVKLQLLCLLSVWKAISPAVLEMAFNTTPDMEKMFRSRGSTPRSSLLPARGCPSIHSSLARPANSLSRSVFVSFSK